MKRPIAMRCNQEQFDSIKDRINLSENSITVFEKYPYLVNCDGSGNSISNICKNQFEWVWSQNPEIHETFNADIFLEACGVEVEKVWKGTDMQFKMASEWVNCDWIQEFRFKPQPNYQKEIEALQQKAKENGQSVTIVFEKL